MNRIVVITLLIVTTCQISAQTPMPALQITDFEGIEIVEERVYKGGELWGLINGGADVYLEYGFEKLLLQRIKFKGHNYRVEIYRMESPFSARGIYSLFRYNCSESIKGISLSCWHDFQVLMLAGADYISISNEMGSAVEKSFCGELAMALYKRTEQDYWRAEGIFEKEVLSAFLPDLKIITGRLALQNSLPEWEPLFEDIEGYSVVMLPATIDGRRLRLAQLTFKREEEVSVLIKRLGLSDALQVDGSVAFSIDKQWMVKNDGSDGLLLLQSLNEPLTKEQEYLLMQKNP